MRRIALFLAGLATYASLAACSSYIEPIEASGVDYNDPSVLAPALKDNINAKMAAKASTDKVVDVICLPTAEHVFSCRFQWDNENVDSIAFVVSGDGQSYIAQ